MGQHNKYGAMLRTFAGAKVPRRKVVVAGGALVVIGASSRLGMKPALAVRNDIGIIAGVGEQREWRFCHKCFGMFYNGDAQGRKGRCPAGGAHDAQGFNFILHYDHTRRQPTTGRDSQYEWRFCSKCFGMFWDGSGDSLGRCPVVTRDREFSDNRHLPYGFIFGLPHDNPANPGQANWRFCQKCFGLFFDDPNNSNKGRCPAGGSHVRSPNSFNFQLPFLNEWVGAPPPSRQSTQPARPSISVTVETGGVIHVTGNGFVGGSSLTVRVADDALANIFVTTIGGQPIKADVSGHFDVKLNGFCKVSGAKFYFSVTDGRTVPSSVDHTGNLWSNTASATCS